MNKKNKIIISITITFILLMSFLCFKLIIPNNFKDKESINKKLDITSQLVQVLLKYVPGRTTKDTFSKSAYGDKKVLIDDFKYLPDSTSLLWTVYLQLNKARGKNYIRTFEKNYEFIDENDLTSEMENCVNDKYCAYDKKIFEQKIKEYYGKIVIFNSTFTDGYDDEICIYDNKLEYYFCRLNENESEPYNINIFKLYKVVKKENEIYIYDKYLHIHNEYEILNGQEILTSKYLSNNKNAQNKIKEWSLEEKIEPLENIMKQYENYATLYKHTFKRNSDGNYNYYSTEPIKK